MSRMHTYSGFAAIIIAATLHAPALMAQEQAAGSAGPVPAEESTHVFPLMKNLVAERPNLPPPYGVSVIYNYGASDWDFKSATIGINDPSLPVAAADDITMHIKADTIGLKGDVWILPFLNLFAVVGKAKADNELVARDLPLGLGPSGVVRGDVVIDFDLDGSFYTLGGVLAGGYKKFFASVDFSATVTDFGNKDTIESNQDAAYSLAPRVGYVVGLSQVWVGARYIDANTEYRGTVPIASGQDFAFDIDLETSSWDLDLGMRTVLQEHWEVMLNAGLGDRQRIAASVGYRW